MPDVFILAAFVFGRHSTSIFCVISAYCIKVLLQNKDIAKKDEKILLQNMNLNFV